MDCNRRYILILCLPLSGMTPLMLLIFKMILADPSCDRSLVAFVLIFFQPQLQIKKKNAMLKRVLK